MALRFNKVLANTRESDHYCTPKDFYDKLNNEFQFTFDPCPLRCEDFNGLEVDWNGVVYCNPPYSHIEVWLEKGLNEIRKGNAEKVVYLIPLRTDSWYWHNKILAFSEEVRLVRGRLRFGNKKDLAPFGVCLIIFDNKLTGNSKLKSYEK
jgi:site-specific DNA-methyltransferase (adenine-specific)